MVGDEAGQFLPVVWEGLRDALGVFDLDSLGEQSVQAERHGDAVVVVGLDSGGKQGSPGSDDQLVLALFRVDSQT